MRAASSLELVKQMLVYLSTSRTSWCGDSRPCLGIRWCVSGLLTGSLSVNYVHWPSRLRLSVAATRCGYGSVKQHRGKATLSMEPSCTSM